VPSRKRGKPAEVTCPARVTQPRRSWPAARPRRSRNRNASREERGGRGAPLPPRPPLILPRESSAAHRAEDPSSRLRSNRGRRGRGGVAAAAPRFRCSLDQILTALPSLMKAEALRDRPQNDSVIPVSWMECAGRALRGQSHPGEESPASRRGTLGRDEYRNFFEEAPFGLPSPRSASARRMRTFKHRQLRHQEVRRGSRPMLHIPPMTQLTGPGRAPDPDRGRDRLHDPMRRMV
jgi:hypothetical protein